MIRIVGGGLAGCEAAWQAASCGVPVTLHEMRPVRPTAVHKTDRLAELVCSNSFRGDKLDNAVGRDVFDAMRQTARFEAGVQVLDYVFARRNRHSPES